MKVKLRDVLPNPFRHIKSYPIKREKVDALKASIEATEFWDNIVARKAGKKIEIAYGHHRLAALNELYEGSVEFDFIVRKLSNDDMLRIMAHENQEEWGSSFWVTLETVRALVAAHSAKQIIDLAVEYQGGHGRVSVAELGFVPDQDETWVAPVAIGKYFGWTKNDDRPHAKVHTALHALRLIAGGHCTEAQFRNIGNEQALAVVREAAVAERAHRQDLDQAERRIKLLAAEAKTATGTKKEAAEKLKADQERRAANARKKLKEEPRKAAQAASSALAAGKGYREAAKAARKAVTAGFDIFDPTPLPDINKVAMDLTNRLDKLLNADEEATTFTQKLVTVCSNAEHIDDAVRRGLARALMALGNRVNILATSLDEQRRVHKPELKRLGVIS